MRGKPILISAATMTAFWPWLKAKFGFQRQRRSANTPTIWRPSSWTPMPSRKAISPASLSRSSSRRIGSPRFSCSPTSAIPATPTWCWCRRSGSTPTAARCRLFVDATRDGWLHYLDNPAKGNALIKRDNPDMTDAILAQALDKMKRYEMLLSGDGRAFGLGSMTDAQWKLFYDTMASEGLYPKGLDYKKAYDLSFRARHPAEISMIALTGVGKRFAQWHRGVARSVFHGRGRRIRLAAGTQRLRQIHRAQAGRRAAGRRTAAHVRLSAAQAGDRLCLPGADPDALGRRPDQCAPAAGSEAHAARRRRRTRRRGAGAGRAGRL